LSLCRRERVKRAKKADNKAESKADSKADKDACASTKPTAAVVAGVPNGEMQKRPDLKELSKDLPSGWQVLLTRETGLCHNLIQCEFMGQCLAPSSAMDSAITLAFLIYLAWIWKCHSRPWPVWKVTHGS
jgi:hypothetical protein